MFVSSPLGSFEALSPVEENQLREDQKRRESVLQQEVVVDDFVEGRLDEAYYIEVDEDGRKVIDERLVFGLAHLALVGASN